jgi:hypothetical protein
VKTQERFTIGGYQPDLLSGFERQQIMLVFAKNALMYSWFMLNGQ